jgi:hypothetical protein
MSERDLIELLHKKRTARDGTPSGSEIGKKHSSPSKERRLFLTAPTGLVNGTRPRHRVEAAAVAAGLSETAISRLLRAMRFRLETDEWGRLPFQVPVLKEVRTKTKGRGVRT